MMEELVSKKVRKKNRDKYKSKHSLQWFFRDYSKKNKDLPVTQTYYTSVLTELHSRMAKKIIDNKFGVKIPYSDSGFLKLGKYKPVNHKYDPTVLKKGIRRRYLNAHTSGFKFRVGWIHGRSRRDSISLYTFKTGKYLKKLCFDAIMSGNTDFFKI